jgi:hypothetical protein
MSTNPRESVAHRIDRRYADQSTEKEPSALQTHAASQYRRADAIRRHHLHGGGLMNNCEMAEKAGVPQTSISQRECFAAIAAFRCHRGPC